MTAHSYGGGLLDSRVGTLLIICWVALSPENVVQVIRQILCLARQAQCTRCMDGKK